MPFFLSKAYHYACFTARIGSPFIRTDVIIILVKVENYQHFKVRNKIKLLIEDALAREK